MKKIIAGILIVSFTLSCLPLGVIEVSANHIIPGILHEGDPGYYPDEIIPGLDDALRDPDDNDELPGSDIDLTQYDTGVSATPTTVSDSDVKAQQDTLKQQQNTTGQAGTGENNRGTNSNYDETAQEGIAGCVGSVVSSMITNAVSSLTGGLTQPQNTPVNNVAGNAKDASGIAGSGITWDQIGYCVANALIQYISQATINWIKSGFEGSPAFIQDPGEFFANIADQEAGQFIQELGGDFLCEEFRPRIQLGLLQSRTTPYRVKAECTASDIIENLEDFANDYNPEDWLEWTQNPQNTPTGAYMMAEEELKNRISIRVSANNKELLYGRGYLPFKVCDTNSKGEKVNCRTTTPGHVVETTFAQSLGLSKDRLVLADEFDEVVTALVKELIKVALNETLGAINN